MAMWDSSESLGNTASIAKQTAEGQYQPPTTRSRLLQKKQVIENELKKVTTALDALDGNPQLEAFMEIIKAANV